VPAARAFNGSLYLMGDALRLAAGHNQPTCEFYCALPANHSEVAANCEMTIVGRMRAGTAGTAGVSS
jgi:hypothetical protein